MVSIPTLPSDLLGVLVFVIGLVILWAIISIPVYFAGKAITHGKSGFGAAMGATLGGGIAYFIVYWLVGFFLGVVLPDSALPLATIIAVIVWLAIYKSSFETGWLGALGIVILAWLILLILDFVLVRSFHVTFPDFFPF
ncbi:MAG: hypothetical protein HY297_03865 [Thaumarchaeota archaeon]|nr:hypothetical protein [Nitrososphaerota archaeon]